MNEYAGHLANMQDKANIVATEDILSDKGVLLAKSGIEINKKTCENILKFKLLKPLEDSIAIANQLNAKSVYDKITVFINEDPWLKEINNKLGDKTTLQRCCLRLDKFPLLEQKLTVLCLELPDVFEQAIFSAWLSYICSLNGKRTQSEIDEYFLAGISHDVGFLHINHEILKKEGDLTAEEWRNIQSHPIIGYEILKGISGYPKASARAVLEHHENLDGSGYPRNKTGQELDHLGQLINLLDNVIAIYNKKCKITNRSIRSVIPVLQINMHSYMPDAVSSIIRTLKEAPESPVKYPGADEVKSLVDEAQNKQVYIQKTTHIIKDTNQQLGYTHNNKDIFSIQNIANNIILIVNSAGLYDTNYTDWLSGLEESAQESVFNEIEETQIMLGEIIYQFQSYQKYANGFVCNYPTHELAHLIQECLNKVSLIPKPGSKGSFKQA